MRLRVDGGETIEVNAGELVLLSRNDDHSFGSDLNAALIPAETFIQPPQAGGISRTKCGGGGEDASCCAASWARRRLSVRCFRPCRPY